VPVCTNGLDSIPTEPIGFEPPEEMIEITPALRDQMVEHALREFPNEACGVLSGVWTAGDPAGSQAGSNPVPGARAERFHPMTNADASPVTYRLDSKEQLKVTEEIEDSGREMVGIVHSHTHSEAFPSETDRMQAFYPDAHYLLISLTDRDHPVLRGFSIRDGVVEEQEVRLT
jgi:proteasome lid subunit RPN8/RPN11